MSRNLMGAQSLRTVFVQSDGASLPLANNACLEAAGKAPNRDSTRALGNVRSLRCASAVGAFSESQTAN